MFKRIVFATDGADSSRQAQAYVTRLAKLCEARVYVFLVYEVPADMLEQAQKALVDVEYLHAVTDITLAEGIEQVLSIKEELMAEGIDATPVIRGGRIGAAIVKEADNLDADLIVLGSKGYGQVVSLLVGSVTDYVLHNSDRPLMIIPARTPTEPGEISD